MSLQANSQSEQQTNSTQSSNNSSTGPSAPPPPPSLSRSTTINAPARLSRQTTGRTTVVQHEIEMAALGAFGPKNPACLPRQTDTIANPDLEANRGGPPAPIEKSCFFIRYGVLMLPFTLFLFVWATYDVATPIWLAWISFGIFMLSLFKMLDHVAYRRYQGRTRPDFYVALWIAFSVAFWAGLPFALNALYYHMHCLWLKHDPIGQLEFTPSTQCS